MNTKRIYRILLIIVLPLLLLVPLALKIWHVENFLYTYTGTRSFGAVQVFVNDAIIYSAILVLFFLSCLEKTPHIVAILLRVLAFFVLLLYVIDYFVITRFNTHLVITDVIKYASYSFKYLHQIYNSKGFLPLILALLLVALIASFIFSKCNIKRTGAHRYFIVMILSLLVVSQFGTTGSDKYVHSWIYKNLVNYNLVVMSEARAYSDDFIHDFSFDEKMQCHSKVAEKRNIIFLMVESLSSYQSELFSGIRNWTPNLDQIATNNTAYMNFYANGFTTEDGEISLLTGRLPIFQPSSYTDYGGISFAGFFDIENSLPNILKKQGYQTEFLTTADLSFANTGDWTKSIGFDYIEGHDHPYYDNWDRFHFKAAPDEALFNRVLDRAKINDANNNNYFIFLKTVSTHHPFINPENKNKSEEEAFRYTDKQIGVFYQKLNDMGFFDNGILVIVGDHHSMIPLKNQEIEVFGTHQAAARIPMIVSSGGRPAAVVNQAYQQTDLFNSIKGLVSINQCHSNWIGDVLGGKPAKYIAHRRGDNRNLISVFSGNKDYLVMLDGDDSRMMDGEQLDQATQIAITSKINSVRLPHAELRDQ